MKLVKNILTLVIVLVFVLTAAFSIETTDVRATSKTQAEAISWVKSQVGKSIDWDGAYGAQCVDLIAAYYNYLGTSTQGGNGCDYATNTLPSGWSRVKGGAPQKGDILVYSGNSSNPYGHVAIYESDRVHYHQNFDAHPYVEKVTYMYNGLGNAYWGYIRPNWGGSVGDCTISVTKGDSATATTWSWTKAANAKTYNLRIKKYNGSEYVAYKDVWNLTGTSHALILPAGDYYAYVDACNGSAYKRSRNSAYCTIKYWYVGKTVNNLGDDFYARIVLTHTNIAPGVNNDTKNIENVAYSSKTDANYLSQYWHFVRNSDGSYRILNAYYKDLPLEAVGRTSGSNVVLGTYYKGLDAQHWWVYGTENGKYIIRNNASEFVLNVHNGYAAAGTNLQIWKYTDSGAERMTIEKHTSHQWNGGTVTKSATCTATGKKKYVCYICGESKTETIKKIGHKNGAWTIEKRATISKDGLKSATCTRCGVESATCVIPEVGTIKLSKTKYTYNGETKNPKVIIKDDDGNVISTKNYTVKKLTKRTKVGKHSYKITFKNEYKGSKKLYFKINPKAASITKKPTAYKKAFTVKWKKVSVQATGYQIKYSTSKKFTSKTSKTVTVKSYKTTSKKITKLKAKKTYYVKVRTYKTVNGVKYYSAWSDYKTVKTK